MVLLSEPFLTIVAILATLIILGTIIALHELGHLIAAKRAGVMCFDYSIGMGPVIYKKKPGETQYSIRAVPIGGFVQMASTIDLSSDILKEGNIGLELDDDNKIIEIVLDPARDSSVRGKVVELDLVGKDNDMYITLEDENGELTQYFMADQATYTFEKNQKLAISKYERTVDSKSKPWRLIVFFAGSFMNFVLAIIIYLIVSFSMGVPNYESNEIGSISSDFPASAYLEVGDKITGINGESVSSWTDFQNKMNDIYSKYQTTIQITFLRDGVENTQEIESVTGFNSIGISNFYAKNNKLSLIPNTTVKGLEIGQVFSKYKNSSDEKYEYRIQAKDYLVGIQIGDTEYPLNNDSYIIKDGLEVSGWGYLTYLVDEYIGKGAPDVKYKYYHLKDDKGTEDTSDDEYIPIDYNNSKIITPYTDEVLESQNVTKILHYIGVGPTTHFSFFGCIGNAFSMFWDDFTMIFRTLKLLLFPSDVRQVGINNLSGVVGIFGRIKSYVNSGIITLLAFVAMLSVNIGIVNLLPIPALDGGKILFVIIEAITGKKVPKKIENAINLVFMLLLLGLMVYVTFNDIMRL